MSSNLLSRIRYWAFKNAYSVDGLPGMQIGNRTGKEEHIAPIEKMIGPKAPRAYRNDRRFTAWHLIVVAVVSAVCTALSLSLPLALFQGTPSPSAS
jgi:hypothetical protein